MLPELDRYLTRERDDRDDAPDPHRQDEERREKLWAEFVAWLREQIRQHGATAVLTEIATVHGYRHYAAETLEKAVWHEALVFAESEGWPSVMHALGRAMAEQEAEAAEIERRR